MNKKILVILSMILLSGLLFSNSKQESIEVVNVYSHRHYDADQQLFELFTEQTGIEVNVVMANADELIERLKAEGENSPADLLVAADVSRLFRAMDHGLLQPVESSILEERIPEHLRDSQGHWFGLTKRARVIVYDNTRDLNKELSYEDLADQDFGGSILIRSSSNIYNISLLSSLIANLGEDQAREWVQGVISNMARTPQGNDRDQMKALIAGEGDYAVVNTYYVGLLLASQDEAEQEVGQRIGIIFPNQNDRGTHINISGAGVTAHAPNRTNAIRLIEFLAGPEAQAIYAQENYEYPVNPSVEPSEMVQDWGEFIEDTLSLERIGENNHNALRLFDEEGWQ